MGKGKHRRGKKSKRKEKVPVSFEGDNLVPEAAPGCYWWRPTDASNISWTLGIPEPFVFADYGLIEGDSVPDLSVDPEDLTLSVINCSRQPRAYHISVKHPAIGQNGQLLSRARSFSNDGEDFECTTFIVFLPPCTVLELCQLDVPTPSVDISSDVVDWIPHPSPMNLSNEVVLSLFPLEGGPYLCTQGWNGALTHFSHPSTFHAVDFRCPIGTPVCAVGDGVITDVHHNSCACGVHVSNLFHWNSLTLQLDSTSAEDSPIFIEYVHIQPKSCTVTPGDRVQAGQIICKSGNIGFCPEPHLHIEAHSSNEPKAPSIPIAWINEAGEKSYPVAGGWYGATPGNTTLETE